MKTNSTSTIRTGTNATALVRQPSARKHGAAWLSAGSPTSLPFHYLDGGLPQAFTAKLEGALTGVGRDNQD
jgi:hypothetical protein